MIFEELKQLLEKKKPKIVSELDQRKYQITLSVIENPDVFLKLPVDTAIGILEFLDIPQAEIWHTYNQIVSFKNHQQRSSYILINEEGIKKESL